MKVPKQEIFHWDVPVWSQALDFWNKFLPKNSGDIKALELASNKGGLSLYMASHGFQVICTDVKNPQEQAAEFHTPYLDQFDIEYREVNALSMPFNNNTFDVVMFKSFLGYLSHPDQVKAIEEIRRVLKPGGVLLFAENLKGSFLHRFVRHYFVSWGREWNYITMAEANKMMSQYSVYQAKSAGFISLFFTNSILKSLLFPIDILICSILPAELKYVLFGAAQK